MANNQSVFKLAADALQYPPKKSPWAKPKTQPKIHELSKEEIDNAIGEELRRIFNNPRGQKY